MIRAIKDFHKIFPANTTLVRQYIEVKYKFKEEVDKKTCKYFETNLKYLFEECLKRANNTWSTSDEQN